MKIGLRIDVDTLRGTRVGVPALCRALAKRAIRASFFFSSGPDNMGRNLWRLLKPAFLLKMLRSNAPGLYGWDILLRGTFWPGPEIGRACAPMIRDSVRDGHELGFHAWDHHAWQQGIGAWNEDRVRRAISRGMAALAEAAGAAPVCSAAPAWKCTPIVLNIKAELPLKYNSDCRGRSIFLPQLADRTLQQPQIPVTLPTFDEAVGRNGVTMATYNDHILGLCRPDALNVLAIHAEVEGGACADMFGRFLDKALSEGRGFCALGDLLGNTQSLPRGQMVRGSMQGREGWISLQA